MLSQDVEEMVNLDLEESFLKEEEIANLNESEDGNLIALRRYKAGELTEVELAKHFERLIYFVIKRYTALYQHHLLLDEADCYNICLFRLFKAINLYKVERGKFTTYAVRAMMSGLLAEYKHNHRAKRKGNSISLDTFMVEDNLADLLYYKYASVEFLPEVIFKEVKENVIEIIQGLGAKEQSKHILIDLFIHQKRPKDISEYYGVTPQAVNYVKKWFMPQLQFEMQRRKLV